MEMRNQAVPFGKWSASDAKWHMIAAIYDREFPPDELLPMLLEAEAEPVCFAVTETTCTANAVWKAVSFAEDGSGASVTGTETAERSFLCTGTIERLNGFLSGIDRSTRTEDDVPAGIPVIPCELPEEEMLAQNARVTQEAESMCRKAVPGIRYEDFDVETECAQVSHLLYLPAYRVTWSMHGKSYCAYIDGRDLSRMCLPMLPLTHRTERPDTAEQKAALQSVRREIQESIQSAEAEWRTRIRAKENDREKLRIRGEEALASHNNELQTNLAQMQAELARTSKRRIPPMIVTGIVSVMVGIPAAVMALVLHPPILPLLMLLGCSAVLVPMIKKYFSLREQMRVIRENMAHYQEHHAAQYEALVESQHLEMEQLMEELTSMERQMEHQLSDLRSQLQQPELTSGYAAPAPRTPAQTEILRILRDEELSDSAKKTEILQRIVPGETQSPEITACNPSENVV